MRLRGALLACAASALLAVGAAAQTPVALPVPAIDPVRLLPPPPPEGSEAQKQELAELHRIQDTRTQADLDTAAWDSVHEDWTAFAPTLGLKFDMDVLPATAKLLKEVDEEQAAAKRAGKAAFQRPRPWIVDSTVVGCDHSDDKPKSSYPSGHATMAYAMAVVLSDLMPDHAGDILQRASDYAYSRLVCGVHFRSDIVAGQALGTAVGTELLHDPAMQEDLTAARAELRAHGLTKG
jgi:acid phosphatase (class A)